MVIARPPHAVRETPTVHQPYLGDDFDLICSDPIKREQPYRERVAEQRSSAALVNGLRSIWARARFRIGSRVMSLAAPGNRVIPSFGQTGNYTDYAVAVLLRQTFRTQLGVLVCVARAPFGFSCRSSIRCPAAIGLSSDRLLLSPFAFALKILTFCFARSIRRSF